MSDALLLTLFGWALGQQSKTPTTAPRPSAPRPPVEPVEPPTPPPATPAYAPLPVPVAKAPWDAATQAAEAKQAEADVDLQVEQAKAKAAGDPVALADIAAREKERRKALADWQADIARAQGQKWRPAKSVRAGEVARAKELLKQWAKGKTWPGLYAGRRFQAALHGKKKAVEVWELR